MVKRKTKFKKLEGEERYTSTEIPVSQIAARAKEENTKAINQNEFIEQSIRYLYELNTLDTELFHFMHVNWHCVVKQRDRLDELNNVNIFYPAEIAISEFSLKHGITRRFHQFINVKIPKGYAADALTHSERIHKLPVENEQGEADLKIVFAKIKSFLQHGQDNRRIPPLYTRLDSVVNLNVSMEAVRSVLKTLYYHAANDADFTQAALSDDEWEKDFKIYPINKLLFELGRLYNPSSMIEPSIADIIFDKDPYMHLAGIACNFHDEIDCVHNCSLSIVSRWGLLIRELCCKELMAAEKLYIPPVETEANQSKPNNTKLVVPQVSSDEHNKLYPAMKSKDLPSANQQPVFVHNSTSSKPAATVTSSPNVNVGSAWARPLVHQGPRNELNGTNEASNGATDNFPPLGSLKISQGQDSGGVKKLEGKKRK